MLARFLVALPLAALATAGVFYAISVFIGTPPTEYPYKDASHIELGRKTAEPKAEPKWAPDEMPPYITYDPLDSGAIPILRSAPLYPPCGSGDGEVLLEFTVKANGTGRDVTVIKATSQCFGKAVVRASRARSMFSESLNALHVFVGRVFEPQKCTHFC